MQIPIINKNNDEKNIIIPCNEDLKIYFDGKLEINGEVIEDSRLKFDFGPIRVNALNDPRYTIPYNDFVYNSSSANNINMFTKLGICSGYHYEHEITKEQYDELQNNFVDTIIDMLNNDRGIFNYIGENILSRLYSLGWEHHDRFIKRGSNNSTLNVDNDSENNEVSYSIKRSSYDCNGMDEIKEEIITLPSQKTKTPKMVSINSRILMASNIIQQNGRWGAAKYIILSKSNFSTLTENLNMSFEPVTNDNSIHIPNITKVGTLYGKDVYITDNENPYILLGRNDEYEPGLMFLPYYIEPIGYVFKDEKIKVVFSIRHAISDLGFYPDLNYFMFYHN